MILHRLSKRARDEDGVAMVIAVVLSAALATLVISSLAVASHSDKATTHGRYWTQALDVAESGVEQAISRIQAGGGSYSGTFTGSTDQGSFSVTVTRQSRNYVVVGSTGSVHPGKQLAATRKVEVTLAPPEMFKNAIYSYTSLVTKNGDTITGDIWANQNVIIDNNTVVHGSVAAATGYVTMGTGSSVDKDIWTGGFNSGTNEAIQATTVGGNAKASVVNPPDPVTCGGADPAKYSIAGGTISGSATTWGTITGTVLGGTTANVCTSAPATISMPTFSYSSGNYDAATLHEYGTPSVPSPTALVNFQAYVAANMNSLSGTFYINQSAPVSESTRVDLTGVTITGDTNIITNTPIFTNGTTDNTTDAVVLLASMYQPPTGSSCDVNHDDSECSIHLKNNFAASANTAVLAYSPYGPTAVKNNALQFGAVYSDSLEVKNNQALTYDPRIDRMVGFGPVTLDIVKWTEIKP